MVLIIDTTIREKIKLRLLNHSDRNICHCEDSDVSTEDEAIYNTDDQSKDLLIMIDEILKDRKVALRDIDAILVCQGPGSFTGVRVGITTANILAYSLNIPIFGYEKEKLSLVLKDIFNSKQKTFSEIVSPMYPEL